MGDWGAKVSKAGHDVLTADDEDLTLKSDFTLLKVAFSGSIDVSGGGEVSVTHNLGYRPQFLVYISNTSDITFLCSTRYTPSPFVLGDSAGFVGADTTKLWIKATIANPDVARYYIFYEQM